LNTEPLVRLGVHNPTDTLILTFPVRPVGAATALEIQTMLWKDGPAQNATESTYECFECGAVIEEARRPACPDCDGAVRNRGTPIE
jgi:hypothetical protein